MGTFKVIPKEIKEQVLARIKNEGVPVSQAAKEHGVNPKTVYNWLRGTTIINPSILEISRLRRENKELKEIIGAITHELQKQKKIRLINTPMKQKLNKTKRAKDLGVSRSSLYYKPKREEIDIRIKERIEDVLKTHHSYGHKRLTITRNWLLGP